VRGEGRYVFDRLWAKILGWTDKRGTEWKIGWLPLGGYVQFAGDRDAVSQPDADWQQLPAEQRSHTFPAQPVWKRALIVLAGPVTNFLFAMRSSRHST
jgi:regulator of sigma E protease